MSTQTTTKPSPLHDVRINSTSTTIRLVSLLPFITDIVHELGLSHLLVGVSHECEFESRRSIETGDEKRPVIVTNSKLDESTQSLPARELAAGWNQINSCEGESLLFAQNPDIVYQDEISRRLSGQLCSFYTVNVQQLATLRPTHILTHVAATGPFDSQQSMEETMEQMLKYKIPSFESIASLNAESLTEIYSLHHRIAEMLRGDAVNVVARGRARLQQTSRITSQIQQNQQQKKRPTVAIVQWTDPLYLTGGFAPELLDLINADITSPLLPRAGQPSCQIDTAQLLTRFEHIVFVPCALPLHDAIRVVDQWWIDNVQGRHCQLVKTSNKKKFAVVDGMELFSWMGLTNVTSSAQVLAEIVYDIQWFGHKDKLWRRWGPPS